MVVLVELVCQLGVMVEPSSTNEPKEKGAEFFIGELQRTHEENNKRFKSLDYRVNALERKRSAILGPEDEMMNALMYGLVVILAINFLPVVVDVVRELVKTWRDSASSSLSAL